MQGGSSLSEPHHECVVGLVALDPPDALADCSGNRRDFRERPGLGFLRTAKAARSTKADLTHWVADSTTNGKVPEKSGWFPQIARTRFDQRRALPSPRVFRAATIPAYSSDERKNVGISVRGFGSFLPIQKATSESAASRWRTLR